MHWKSLSAAGTPDYFCANLKRTISDYLLIQEIFHGVMIHYWIQDFN